MHNAVAKVCKLRLLAKLRTEPWRGAESETLSYSAKLGKVVIYALSLHQQMGRLYNSENSYFKNYLKPLII